MRWALVLSGGGARGFAHIGLIRELEKRRVPKPALVAGTSMGAIIAALYASGRNADWMENYARDFRLTKLLENPTFRLPDFALSKLLQAGTALGALSKGRALDSGRHTMEELERILGKNSMIEDLPIPFACVAADLLSGKQAVLDSGSVVKAVRASTAYPAVFAPLEYRGMLLVDGGIVNNLPLDIAYDRGIKNVLAMDVSPIKPQKSDYLANGISILMRCFDIACNAAEPKPQRGSLVLESFDRRSVFNFDEISKAIQLGQQTAIDQKKQIDYFFSRLPHRAVLKRRKIYR